MIPVSGFTLQEAALAKEQARIQAQRERNAKRHDLFINNPRERIMGLPKQALDEQVAAMRRSRDEAKEADRNEKLRIVQMQNLLEQNAQEEGFMRAQARDELKRNWAEDVARKRLLKDATPFLFDEQKCGPASAQVFQGFDEEQREAKARIQQKEMKTWVAEALIEQKQKQKAEKEEDLRYASLLKTLDYYRETAEMEEKEMEKIAKLAVKDENVALAAEHHRMYDKQNPLVSTSLDLFNEDVYAAMDPAGRIVRRDHFKGFTPAQQRRLRQENEIILQQKKLREAEEKQAEMIWTKQQQLIEQALVEASAEEAALREQEKLHYLSVLRAQAESKARALVKYKQEQREDTGYMEGGYYDGFEKSHR